MPGVSVRSQERAATVSLLAVLSGLASACASQPVPERPPDRPAVRVEQTSTAPVSAFEDPGTIIVDSDMVCGEGDEGEAALAGSFALPSYANAATVLLNGWRLRARLETQAARANRRMSSMTEAA